VNRTEGWGSLRFAIPLVLFAVFIAGLLSTNPAVLGGSTYFTAIAYLVFITIVIRKIIGTLRNWEGAEAFTRLLSVLSTWKLHGENPSTKLYAALS